MQSPPAASRRSSCVEGRDRSTTGSPGQRTARRCDGARVRLSCRRLVSLCPPRTQSNRVTARYRSGFRRPAILECPRRTPRRQSRRAGRRRGDCFAAAAAKSLSAPLDRPFHSLRRPLTQCIPRAVFAMQLAARCAATRMVLRGPSRSRPTLQASGWGDSNSRPPAPKAGALPGCATSRRKMSPDLEVRAPRRWVRK